MKKLLITLLMIVNIYANENIETNSTQAVYWSTLLKMANDVNGSEIYKAGSEYIDSINTQENRDKAVALYEKAKDKISSFNVQSISDIACSDNNDSSKDEQCNYWKNQEKLSINASAVSNEFCDVNSIKFKDIKVTDIKMQELEALFIGLCQKVKQEDLTSKQAEIILEENQIRLLN